MQRHVTIPEFTLVTPEAPMSPGIHGGRAKCLQRLIRLELPAAPSPRGASPTSPR